ncbi:MAG: hypothetical protein RAK24_00115 [TACK group archaeon]|nr:hypothetical protein [TACK group archaeon]
MTDRLTFKEEPSSNLGEDPWKRPLNRLLSLGVINLDKPSGPSSHEVAAWVKRMLGLKKVGHGGTLETMVGDILQCLEYFLLPLKTPREPLSRL